MNKNVLGFIISKSKRIMLCGEDCVGCDGLPPSNTICQNQVVNPDRGWQSRGRAAAEKNRESAPCF